MTRGCVGESERPLKVAMIIPDNRDERRVYAGSQPVFGPAPAALLEGMALLPEVEVHVISCLRSSAEAPEKLADNIHFHALRVPSWSGLKSAYLPQILAIRRLVTRLRPHLVHGQGTERYCALAAVFSGVPSLITIHGNMRAVAEALSARTFSYHGVTAVLEAVAVKRGAGVVCLSEYTRTQVQELARNTWIVPNAVGERYFSTAPRSEGPRRLLCPALVCNYKNQNALIAAVDPIAQELDLQLCFAGGIADGAYGIEFQKLVAERPWCHHLGYLSDEELRVEYLKSTMMILPSLEDNCPMAILEAMAMGIPVAAGRSGGIPELVSHGVTGVLFNPSQVSEMCAVLRAVLAQPDLLRRMGQEAHEAASSRFRPGVVARSHRGIYEQIREQSSPA